MRSFAKRRHQHLPGRRREKIKKFGRRFSTAASLWSRRIQRWWLYGAGALAAVAVGVALFSPILVVREIRVQRSEGRVDVARIQEALAPLFGRHLLFVSAREVTSRVSDVVPDLDAVSVTKQYPSLLFVRITLQPIIARLILEEPKPAHAASGAVLPTGSGAAPPLPTVRRYDYLTANGLYVTSTDAMTPSKLPTIKIVDWGVRPLPGSLLVSPNFLARMQQTQQILQDQFSLQIVLRTVYLRAEEFHFATSKFSLWFDAKDPVADQIGRYRTFLQAVGLKAVRQYVDLRLTGRVVYR